MVEVSEAWRVAAAATRKATEAEERASLAAMRGDAALAFLWLVAGAHEAERAAEAFARAAMALDSAFHADYR